METIQLDRIYITTLYNRRFLLDDTNGENRIIAFASDYQLEILSKSSWWHSGSPFKASSELFSQINLIHAWYLKEMHPCAFILTPDRTISTYKKLLRQLKQSSTVNLQPSQSFVNIEEGAIRAFKEEFPGVQIKGYHFHFTQCIWRKIQEIELSVEYKEDKKVRV